MINIDNLLKRLIASGYLKARIVSHPGDMYDGEIFISKKVHVQVGFTYIGAVAFSAKHGYSRNYGIRSARQLALLLADIKKAKNYRFKYDIA